ncbi:MAG: hypothetical protein EOP10_12055 [Proteobacteria bacterium]|nr:MAG: hypothetical protein EOP10_12055 [Pseudomonadota bacterium]
MTRAFFAHAVLLSTLIGLAVSCNSGPQRNSYSKGDNARAKAREANTSDSQATELPSEETDLPGSAILRGDPLNLKLSATPELDAYDFTFGSVKVTLETKLSNAGLIYKRGLLLKKGVILDADKRAFANRLCKDMGLSDSADTFVMAKKFTGADLFLMWRSHFGADVKVFLADYLAKNGESLRCVLSVSIESAGSKEATDIVFDPLAESTATILGSAKAEAALKEGLLMVASHSEQDLLGQVFENITLAEKITTQVAALNALDFKLDALDDANSEQCYLISNGGTTKPFNPNSMSGAVFSLKGKAEYTSGDLKPRTLAGRLIKECAAIKIEKSDTQVAAMFSCADYFAIKDQGMEAGCAWELPIAHKTDPENFFTLPLIMEKLNVRTRDGGRVLDQSSLSVIPLSGINDIRDGKVNLSALSKGQAQLLEDGLDIWIAVDEKSYRDNFYNHIKTISWDGACTYGAYAQYGSDMITWCGGGGLTEQYASRRFQDPNLMFYRGMLAYHESLHTRNRKHDVEDKTYQPCAGTANAAILSTYLLKTCNFDFCKQLKPAAVTLYKNELNYNYNGDTTGRKGQGDCKKWSTELGVSGEGF